MRTFSCFVSDSLSAVPTLSFILAKDEDRARVLARRELLDNKHALSVEVCEGGKALWTERVCLPGALRREFP
jgi:hypothetical protein